MFRFAHAVQNRDSHSKGGHTPLATDHCQRLPGIARAWEIRGLESALEGLPRLRPITGLNVRHPKMELMERIAGIALDAFFE